MRIWWGFLFFWALWPALSAWAEETPPGKEAYLMEEVVVTATRTAVPAKETGVSYTVITDKEIKERQATRVEEMLRDVPGATISQTGGRGGTTSLFLRGGNSNHTQVLLNGMRLNDAGGDFDFNTLTVDNLERIEVIRGPMSALYGADAMTGVVNLVTKKGTGPPTLSYTGQWGAHSENGFFNGENRLSFLGAYKNFGYSMAYSRIDDDGILRLNNRFHSNVLNSRLDLDPLENLSFTFTTFLVDSFAGFPTVLGGDKFDAKSAGGPGLDPDRNNTKTDLLLGLTANYWPFKWWENELNLAYCDRDRRYNDPNNPETAIDTLFGAFFSRNLERRSSLDYHSNFRFGAKAAVESISTLGVAARSEQLKQSLFFGATAFGPPFTNSLKTSRTSTAFYAQQQLSLVDRVFVTAGFRMEDNSVFDHLEFTPRASAAFVIKETDTVLRAAGGRAIKEPTFLESYSRDQLSVANPKLRPERNVAWEAGVDQYFLKDRGKFSVTYFENHFSDFITFVPRTFPQLSSYENIGEVRTKGFEFALRVRPGWGLTVGAAYTYFTELTVLDDGGVGGLFFRSGQDLLRRPRHTFSFDLDYVWRRLEAHLNGLYAGSRDDSLYTFTQPFTFNSSRVVNGPYFVLNLAVAYDLIRDWGYIKKVQLLAKANNLLDRNYMEVYGYSFPRFQALGGLRLVF